MEAFGVAFIFIAMFAYYAWSDWLDKEKELCSRCKRRLDEGDR